MSPLVKIRGDYVRALFLETGVFTTKPPLRLPTGFNLRSALVAELSARRNFMLAVRTLWLLLLRAAVVAELRARGQLSFALDAWNCLSCDLHLRAAIITELRLG